MRKWSPELQTQDSIHFIYNHSKDSLGVGWELGRGVTSIPWYRANIRPLIQDAFGVQRDEYPKYDILNDINPAER